MRPGDHLGVGWAVAVVVVLLVGMPVAAVWWSRRAFWARLRAGRERDPFGDTMRRHGLGAAAMARVEDAVLRGKRLEDPAERAAVVDLAREALPRRPASRPGAVVLLLVVAWVCLAVAGAVWATVEGRWGDVPWVPLLFGLLFGGFARGPARALRRNSDRPQRE